MKGEQVDLSEMTDSEVSDLYWAVYDLNAAILRLMKVGLASEGGACDINATMTFLEGELQMRRDMKAQMKKRTGGASGGRSWTDLPPF